MFEKYDERAEVRVRRAFRLPPIFVGQAADYSFATAYASYTVAEAQVFQPERGEFDEIISIRLLPVMGFTGYRMRSLPMQINDVPNQLKGLQLANSSGWLEPAELFAGINELVGLNLKVADQPVLKPGDELLLLGTSPGGGKSGKDDEVESAQNKAGERAGTPSNPVTTPLTKEGPGDVDIAA
jgi:hypothetical protein